MCLNYVFMSLMLIVESEIRARGQTLADFAQQIGVTPPNITNWKKRGIPGNKYQLVAEGLGWTVDELLAGGPGEASKPQPIAPGPDFVAIERVNLQVSAGVTGFAIEHLNGNGPPIFFRADWLKAEGLRADRLFALRVSGDSMEPSLWDGDLVVINVADSTPRDGVVFVLNYEGEVLIKRLERDAGDWWLTSDNGRYKRKRCDEHALLIGQVIYKQSGRI